MMAKKMYSTVFAEMFESKKGKSKDTIPIRKRTLAELRKEFEKVCINDLYEYGKKVKVRWHKGTPTVSSIRDIFGKKIRNPADYSVSLHYWTAFRAAYRNLGVLKEGKK